MNCFLQLNAPFFTSFLVLVVMSCIALIFSSLFYLKSRAIRKLPKNLSVKVFSKTFNVLNPYLEERKIVHNFISFFPIFIMEGSLILASMLMVAVFGMHLVLSLITLIICVNLIVLDEALDVYKHAGIFIRANKNGAPFGSGDLVALYVIRESLPKLTMYYFILAITFLVLSLILPYIALASLSALTMLFLMFEFTTSIETLVPFAPFFVALLFAIGIVVAHAVVKKVKRKIFGFPSQEKMPGPDFDAIRDKLAMTLSHGVLLPEVNEKSREK